MDLFTLYSQLVLRDFLSYVVPGALVLSSIIVFRRREDLFSQRLTFPVLLFALLPCYLAGHVLQAIGFELIRDNPVFSYLEVPERHTEKVERTADVVALFARLESRSEGRILQIQHERIVFLKQFTANSCLAFLIGSILLFLRWRQDLLKTKKQWLVFWVLSLLIVGGLWRYHERLRKAQGLFEARLMENYAEHTGQVEE